MYPIADLNGCLLGYLDEVEGAHASKREDIGCAIPWLVEGNVKLQVLPVYVGVERGSAAAAWRQVECFQRLIEDEEGIRLVDDPAESMRADGVGVALAVESASCLCDEEEKLDAGLVRLERILETARRVVYLTLTRQQESRFGGGCNTPVGLKDDGRVLLEYLSGRSVAVDLSHASEPLAREVLEFTERRGLDLPVVASHSNFKAVWDHASNLPDDVASEVIRRGGLVGINLIRAFVHPDDPAALARHVEHGLALGGDTALCFGADFFCSRIHPDRSRAPFYFEGHEHAGRYPDILGSLEHALGRAQCEALAFGNAVGFLQRLWGKSTPSESGD
ncbi:MAG: dipeptidase [Planctomycetota bacterium]|jgi:microsomal dipeptidase-like Zn-dependent dipeptidase